MSDEPDWMKEFYRKVTEDKGITPGNDQCIVLECGHTALPSVPHYTTWVYKVGDEYFCTECAGLAEKKDN